MDQKTDMGNSGTKQRAQRHTHAYKALTCMIKADNVGNLAHWMDKNNNRIPTQYHIPRWTPNVKDLTVKGKTLMVVVDYKRIFLWQSIERLLKMKPKSINCKAKFWLSK